MKGTPGKARLALLIVCALALLALPLSGCGSSDDSSSISTNTEATETGDSSEPGGTDSDVSPAGQKILEFGSEAEGGERQQIVAGFDAYWSALDSGNYAAACAHLTPAIHKLLTRIASADGEKGNCSKILGKRTGLAEKTAHERAGGEVDMVRVEDERAYVIFKAPGADLYQMPMGLDGGEWKVGLVVGAVLVPSS